jgi:glc operon protein GlcG
MTQTLRFSLAGALALALAQPAAAQTASRTILTLAGARAVSDAAEAEAHRLSAGGAIAIVDEGGALLTLVRLDNTFPAAATVAVEKARTAAQFRRPTQVFEDAIKDGRLALLGVSVMTPLQGGVPIVVDGQVVGAIGVSGAASAAQDAEIANAAATALQKARVKS